MASGGAKRVSWGLRRGGTLGNSSREKFMDFMRADALYRQLFDAT